MERLFNRKDSGRPTWLCILMAVVVLYVSFIVFTDLAGIMDFVFRSEPMEVRELSRSEITYVLPDSLKGEYIDRFLDIVEKRAKRGMFSYYLEAYPIVLLADMRDITAEIITYVQDIHSQKAMLDTQEKIEAFENENNPKLKQFVEDKQVDLENAKEKLELCLVATVVYKSLALLLSLLILRIPTGLGTKIQYRIYTRKIRWVM